MLNLSLKQQILEQIELKKLQQALHKVLKAHNRVWEDIESEGNCLFNAISMQVDGHQENHKYYREKCT